MKFILLTLLLFAVGFFGTDLAINPNSPVNINKLMSKKESIVQEEDADKEKEETLDKEDKKDKTDKKDTKEDKVEVDPNVPVVTKRPADLSKPIALTSKATILHQNNLLEFLADKMPNLVIVMNLSSEANRDLIDSLNVLLEEFEMTGNVYAIDTSATNLTVERGAIVIDDNIRLSQTPAIYYQHAGLVTHHRNLRRADYNSLHQFFTLINKPSITTSEVESSEEVAN